ncbi:MAG: tRNA-intron lyase [Candidatus Woesearchaeota archaeon]|nr:MAG: tRNA-intron lyase [Candidatus Woesearchaeota archaeon]
MAKDKPIKATLIKNKVVVKGKNLEKAQQLYDKSRLGEVHGTKEVRVEYPLVEALYLLETEKMMISDDSKKLKFEKFADKAAKLENNFWTRYKVFRDLKTRGYVLKTALKFGADFRVYERGTRPGKAHAKWILYCVDENDKFSWREFAAKNRVAHSTRKKLLIGCVDEEGDVTYWQVGWKKP